MLEHYKNDKSTVFSIAPFQVNEFRPGLYPGNFKIPACLNDTVPERLSVGASVHIIHIADRKEPLQVVTPSFQIAKSITDDFLDGQLWTNPNCHPGIAWIQGDVSIESFKTLHKNVFDAMRAVQRNWYVNVCNQTDNEWKKYQNTRVVSDQARFAAKVLGLEPEWMTAEVVGFTFNKCPACNTANNANNAVCTNCRCILDEGKFKTLKFAS